MAVAGNAEVLGQRVLSPSLEQISQSFHIRLFLHLRPGFINNTLCFQTISVHSLEILQGIILSYVSLSIFNVASFF